MRTRYCRAVCQAGPHIVGAVLVAGLTRALLAQAIYVPNFATSNLSGYLVDPATGALSSIPGLPVKSGTSPVQTAIHPGGKFLYVADSGSNDITLYSIAAPSGTLSQQPCPNCEANSPSAMVIDPSGRFLFVTSRDFSTVTPYTIDSLSGRLTKLPGANTGPHSTPVHAMVDPTGRYLYVADSLGGSVAGFAINGGSLTPVPGSPFPAGSGPSAVAASQTSVFVANQFSGDISSYRISAAGSLIRDPQATPVGGTPTSVAVDPGGTYVYVANQAQLIALNTSPTAQYPLTYLRAYNAGTVPSFVAVDPDGAYVYVVNTISNDVSGFAISAGGTLLPAGSASMAGVSSPRMLSVGHIGDPTTISLRPGFPSPSGGSPFGTEVVFSGIVRDNANPATVPTGSIFMLVNGKPLTGSPAVLSSAAAFQIALNSSTQYLAVGTNILQFTYAPGPGFEAPAPLRVAYTVVPAIPTVAVSTPVDAAAGQVVTVTAAMPQIGGRFPTGSVRFLLDGAQTGGTLLLSAGVATVTLVPSPGSHALSAVYSGDSYFAAVNSAPVTFTARFTSNVTVTSAVAAPTYGLAPLFSVAVSSAGSTIGGTVDLFDNGVKINATPLNVSGGRASYQSGVMSTGPHQIAARFAGDASNLPSSNFDAPLSITIARASPQLAVPMLIGSAAKVPLVFSVAFLASVPGAALPTGTVNLLDAGSALGSASIVNGTATFSVSRLPAGVHSISAGYSGDVNYTSSLSAILNLPIAKTTPQLTLSTNSGFPVVGQAVTVTATVTGYSPVTGTVKFLDGALNLSGSAVPVTSGAATLTIIPASAGTHSISAFYSGDGNNEAASTAASPLLLVVAQAQTSVVLTVSGQSVFGQSLTANSSVSAVAPGRGTPTGSIELRDGNTVLATIPLSAGGAAGSVKPLVPGEHRLSAFYNGDSNFFPSQSPAVNITEAKAPTTASLSVSQSRLQTALSLFVSGVQTVSPTGDITFSLDGRAIGTAPLVAQASGALATLQVGPVSGALTAIYPGDGNFQPSSPAPVSIVPLPKLPLSFAVSTIPTLPSADQPFNCDIKVSGIGDAAATGAVQVFDAGALVGSAHVNPDIVITLSLSAGSHTLLITYAGDSNYVPVSTNLSLTIARVIPTAALAADVTSTVYGQNVSFVASLGIPSSLNLPLPSGSIQFLDGNNLIATAIVNNGSARAFSTTLSPGIHQITAAYSGDSKWQAVTSNGITLTVKKAGTAVAIGTSEPPDLGGEAVILSAFVTTTAAGAGTPSGVIDFVDPTTNEIAASGPLSNGKVTITASPDMTWKSLVAAYRGDAIFQSSSSGPPAGIAVVNAASYDKTCLTPNEIATVFASGLATDVLSTAPAAFSTLGGLTVTFIDSTGRAYDATLFYASPSQASFITPSYLPSGAITMKISTALGQTFTVAVRSGSVAPGLFTANATGQGAAAAQVIRVHSDGSQELPQNTAVYDPSSSSWTAAPIAPALAGDAIYLILYATGVRNHSLPVSVAVNGALLPAQYAGAQPSFAGLDQVNVQLPDSLQTGDLHISLTVDGLVSNTATVAFSSGDSAKTNTIGAASDSNMSGRRPRHP